MLSGMSLYKSPSTLLALLYDLILFLGSYFSGTPFATVCLAFVFGLLAMVIRRIVMFKCGVWK